MNLDGLIGATTMCELLNQNPKGGMGNPSPSLGLIKPTDIEASASGVNSSMTLQKRSWPVVDGKVVLVVQRLHVIERAAVMRRWPALFLRRSRLRSSIDVAAVRLSIIDACVCD